MIGNILSESVLIATAGLVMFPVASRRFARALRPSERVRLNAATTLSGIVMLEAALIVCAVPVLVVLSSSSHIDRHFFPGDAIVGWGSTAAAVVIASSLLCGWVRFRRSQDRLRVEPWIGVHRERAGYDVVILESDRSIAYAVGGRRPQIVVTTGLVADLTGAELRSVLEHERAHLRRGHRRFLALLGALEPAGRFLAPIRRAVGAAQFALEHAADMDTSDSFATRSALLKLHGAGTQPVVAAFAAGDVVDRISALSNGAHSAAPLPGRALMYASALTLVALSLIPLVMFWL